MLRPPPAQTGGALLWGGGRYPRHPSPVSIGGPTLPPNGRFFGTELPASAPTQTPILSILSIQVA